MRSNLPHIPSRLKREPQWPPLLDVLVMDKNSYLGQHSCALSARRKVLPEGVG